MSLNVLRFVRLGSRSSGTALPEIGLHCHRPVQAAIGLGGSMSDEHCPGLACVTCCTGGQLKESHGVQTANTLSNLSLDHLTVHFVLLVTDCSPNNISAAQMPVKGVGYFYIWSLRTLTHFTTTYSAHGDENVSDAERAEDILFPFLSRPHTSPRVHGHQLPEFLFLYLGLFQRCPLPPPAIDISLG